MVVTRPPGRNAIITVDFDLENGSLKSADVSISSLKAGWLEHAEADAGPVPPVPPNEAPTRPGAAGTEAQDPSTGATVVAPPDGQERAGGEVPETAQTMANRQEEAAAGSTPVVGPTLLATCHGTQWHNTDGLRPINGAICPRNWAIKTSVG